MTTLPPPPGYINKGKGVSRRLTDAEVLTVAEYAIEHGYARAGAKFGVDRNTARKCVKRAPSLRAE